MSDTNFPIPDQKPLNLIMPLKKGVTMDNVKGFLESIAAQGVEAINEIGTVHFLRIVPIDDRNLGVMTMFDGTFEKYLIDFATTLGTAFFDPLFDTAIADGPPTPVLENMEAFGAYMASHNHMPLMLYSASMTKTVQDIHFAFDD